MIIDRRAYFNLLRMHSAENPDAKVEIWQIEDYRAIPTETLFERLGELGTFLDQAEFHVLTDENDTPEDLADQLKPSDDRLYLIIFELWRRLTPEKQCLSIFCDELDYQVNLYNQGRIVNIEALEDALANLQMVLDENTDQGADPKETFNFIKIGCANDIEGFLYDFIATQIDEENETYATELLDSLSPYVHDVKWFTLLKIRLLAISDPPAAKVFVRQLVRKAPSEPDLDFNLETLSFLIQGGEKEVFIDLLKQTIPLIQTEEDFQDLLGISSDYFRCLDLEQIEKAIQKILKERKSLSPENPIQPQDPHFSKFLKIVG